MEQGDGALSSRNHNRKGFVVWWVPPRGSVEKEVQVQTKECLQE